MSHMSFCLSLILVTPKLVKSLTYMSSFSQRMSEVCNLLLSKTNLFNWMKRYKWFFFVPWFLPLSKKIAQNLSWENCYFKNICPLFINFFIFLKVKSIVRYRLTMSALWGFGILSQPNSTSTQTLCCCCTAGWKIVIPQANLQLSGLWRKC